MRLRPSLAALVLSLTGCFGAETVASTSSTAGTQESQVTTSTTHASEPETIADFFGWESDDPEAFAELQRQATIRVEETIRLCMAEDGFDYVPVVPPDEQASGLPPDMESESPAWGIEMLLAEVTSTAEPGWADPNQGTVDAMSDTEREEWNRALYGTGGEDQPGCMAESYQNEPAFRGVGRLPDDLEAELAAMNQRVATDPRVVAAEAEWSSCMAADGYSHFSIENFFEEVEAEFGKRFDAVVPPVTYYGMRKLAGRRRPSVTPSPGGAAAR